MLHKKLVDYLEQIEFAIKSLTNCHIEKYEEEQFSSNRINLRIRVRFSNGNLFELNEAVIVENDNIQQLSYRYHFQDIKNQILFRYDNTPHFPEIKTFPFHKHTQNEVIQSQKPTIAEIIQEIKFSL